MHCTQDFRVLTVIQLGVVLWSLSIKTTLRIKVAFSPVAEGLAIQTFWISTEFTAVPFPRFVLKNDFCAQSLSLQLYAFFFNMFLKQYKLFYWRLKTVSFNKIASFFPVRNWLEALSSPLCVFIFLFFFILACCVTSKYHSEQRSIKLVSHWLSLLCLLEKTRTVNWKLCFTSDFNNCLFKTCLQLGLTRNLCAEQALQSESWSFVEINMEKRAGRNMKKEQLFLKSRLWSCFLLLPYHSCLQAPLAQTRLNLSFLHGSCVRLLDRCRGAHSPFQS